MSRCKLRIAATLSVSLVALAAHIPAAAQQPTGQTEWGVPVYDVQPDPDIRFGRLPNGMKYAIMRNGFPDEGAAIRFHFDFGSVLERDDELGLAHFIEHMAFNGSANVDEGEMTKILERHGLQFGADTNARTGYDETVYMLELPNVQKDTLDAAFFLMGETADELTFDASAVDSERGVVLGENRTRRSGELLSFWDRVGFVMPNTKFPDRNVIGSEEVLSTAPAARMKALYHRYYRPGNATFVFVGDVDPAEIEQRIRDTFGNWTLNGEEAAAEDLGSIDFDRPAAFHSFAHPEVAPAARIYSLRPYENLPDTMAERRKNFAKMLGFNIFNLRLSKLANQADSPISIANAYDDTLYDMAEQFSIMLMGKDDWRPLVPLIEQEYRRMLQHGVTPAEVETAKRFVKGSIDKLIAQKDSRPHGELAEAIVSQIGTNSMVTAPATKLEMYETLAPGIGVEEINEVMRDVLGGSAPLVHITARGEVSDDEIAALLSQSRQVAVAPPASSTANEFAYDNFGKPGEVVADERIDDLGIRTVRFANNVRLNMRKSDAEAGAIGFQVAVGGGSSALEMDKTAAGFVASLASPRWATAKHNMNELQELLAGQAVTQGFHVTSDDVIMLGTTKSDDLAMQMKVSAATLSDPGFRPEGTNGMTNIAKVILDQQHSMVMSYGFSVIPFALTHGAAGLPDFDAIEAFDMPAYVEELRTKLLHGPIDISIVGDFEESEAIAAVASTFGALPERPLSNPGLFAREHVDLYSGQTLELTHNGDADQAVTGIMWPTVDDENYETVVGLALLKEVFQRQLLDKVREEMGASYGASVSNVNASWADYGYMLAHSVVSPDEIATVQEAILETAAKLRELPLDADTIERARRPMIEDLIQSRQTNDYWRSIVLDAQRDPETLRRARQREELLKGVTASELQALAQKYLVPDQIVRIAATAVE